MKLVTYNIQYGVGKDWKSDLGRIAQAVDGADTPLTVICQGRSP